MTQIKHLTMEELESGLEEIQKSPKDEGLLELIARRPKTDEREVLSEGILDPSEGLVGDNWKDRSLSRMAHPLTYSERQLTLINSRLAALLAQEKERWSLAGDQLYVDLDLSEENLPPGTKLSIGSAVIQITAQPHTGCKKFVSRFGLDAMKFVNSPVGKQLHLRGLYAMVLQSGAIKLGDRVKKI